MKKMNAVLSATQVQQKETCGMLSQPKELKFNEILLKQSFLTLPQGTRVSQKVMSPVNFNRFNLHIFSRNFKGV